MSLTLGVVAACTTSQPAIQPDPKLSTAAPPVTTQALAAPDPPAAPEPMSAKTWKDPAVVDRLAKDCRWRPAPRPTSDGELRDPMSCVLEVNQSCVPNICFEEIEYECKPACVKACGECGESCATTCEACKQTCKDDACRHACAAQCGECRDGCLREEDRCRTATCGAAGDACEKRVLAEWKKSTCPSVCKRVAACASRCWEREDSEACSADCRKRLMVGCPEQFFPYCLFDVKP